MINCYEQLKINVIKYLNVNIRKEGKKMERVFIRDLKLGEVNHLAGFVENIRNKKWMCFIVLRDVTGKIQLTIEKEKHPELIETLDQITIDTVIERSLKIKKACATVHRSIFW